MNRLLLILRLILGLCCAAALLFTFSYPDSIIPPNPDRELMAEQGLYGYSVYLWLLPFLALELVSLAGRHRNFVWFSSLLSMMVLGLLAWPLLAAYRPELLHPTFPYEDGKLSLGLGYMAILLVGSVFLRCLLLRYFFSEPSELYEDNDIGAVELDIEKAQTVRQIVAANHQVAPRFLFGEADHGLIARFYARARVLLRLRRYRAAAAVGLFGLALLWFFGAPALLTSPAKAEARDWDLMYDYTTLPDGRMVATHAAVHAAYRVFERISAAEALAGMTVPQAEAKMRLQAVAPSYLAVLRDESELSMNSAEDIFDSRTRFLTITDGTRRVVLYVRMNAEGDRINICELQDDGWNAVMDYDRRRLGSDWRNNVLSR